MDNSNLQRNRHNDLLGVNKIGKNIRKSPSHQPNFTNTPARQQPQPQVYNINKNDFRNIVQQLTGSPSHHDPLPRPPSNPPKSPSMRLQKIRPPPLAPVSRLQIPIHPPATAPLPPAPAAVVPNGNNFVRPPPPAQYGVPSPTMFPPLSPVDPVWANTAESPISAYMRYLQNSLIDSGPRQNQPQSQPPQQVPGQFQTQPPSSELLPNPMAPTLPMPRMNGPPTLPMPRMNGPPTLPSAHMNGPPSLTSTRMSGPSAHPSAWMSGPAPFPSPTSQFLLPSPGSFLNLLSPRSPYPLLSPGNQHPPPLTPNFSFSSVAQSGILGPGPQLPPSPGYGYGFPLSPSGFYPISSPRWRDQ